MWAELNDKLLQLFVKSLVLVQPALPVIRQQAATWGDPITGSYRMCCHLGRPSRWEQAAATANKASVQSVQSWDISELRCFIRREEALCAFSTRFFYTGVLFQRLWSLVQIPGPNMLRRGVVSVALLFLMLTGECRFFLFLYKVEFRSSLEVFIDVALNLNATWNATVAMRMAVDAYKY